MGCGVNQVGFFAGEELQDGEARFDRWPARPIETGVAGGKSPTFSIWYLVCSNSVDNTAYQGLGGQKRRKSARGEDAVTG